MTRPPSSKFRAPARSRPALFADLIVGDSNPLQNIDVPGVSGMQQSQSVTIKQCAPEQS
jgi:hypothetical protein